MKTILNDLLLEAIKTLKDQGELSLDFEPSISLDRSKDKSHGDFSSNIAFLLSKSLKQAPRKMAELLVSALPPHPFLVKVEIAGPGFINFFLQDQVFVSIIKKILSEREVFGHSNLGQEQRVLVEFVSSNPTGPLHVGHGRGAAFGASLCNILAAAGFSVSREYYVNDAGRQMDILAVSVWLRYLALLGEPVIFPQNAYRGEYVYEIAKLILNKDGEVYRQSWSLVKADLPADENEGGDKEVYIDALITKGKALLGEEAFQHIHRQALDFVLKDIKVDLGEFGVFFDYWFSERSLFVDGSTEKGIEALKAGGHTYLKNGALWFKATEFGDEKDRVLLRANGQSTYFAADVAYHWNKYERGFKRVINIFGSDHHGYVTRVKAAVTALGHDESALDVLLVQFAILYKGGERVQMSTRSGSFVTLRELRDEVGNDAARFFYVMRKPEQHMDFDLDLAKSQSNDNPVYYIQYAHARISSLFRQLTLRDLSHDEALGLAGLDKLTDQHELKLISLLAQYPELIEKAALQEAPHLVSYYLRDLASALHSYYNAIFLLCEDEALRNARLCLLKAIAQVLKNGLLLLGVSAPESM